MILRWIVNKYLEWSTRKLTLDEIAEHLLRVGEKMAEHYAGLPEGDENRQKLRHVIGIERWGQRRLRVALGEPYKWDKYNEYQPSEDLDWKELIDTFQNVRCETAALAKAISEQGDAHIYIRHNQFGDFSVRSWFRYLDMHTSMESVKLA
jgi:hypothetical protein